MCALILAPVPLAAPAPLVAPLLVARLLVAPLPVAPAPLLMALPLILVLHWAMVELDAVLLVNSWLILFGIRFQKQLAVILVQAELSPMSTVIL